MCRMSRLVVAVLIAACVATAARAELLQPGDPFPSWSLPDQTGKTVSASDLAGKPYLIGTV